MVELDETLLPGVGVRYGLTTRAGDRLAVVIQREGGAEVAVLDPRDPDRARGVIRLDADETGVLAELLGAPRLTQRFVDLSREVPGLESGRFVVRPGSPFDGRPLGETRARTLTGCSIVAVVRETDVVPSPGPTDVLHAGDVLVAIGSGAGLTQLAARLDGAA
ncbi:cation:proton antiporter regulatory subunit [Geodermatophilus normandii]|uniref:cation:proton antiporter regulatory subunit n=1 Tax=Geodermatophilus normandii TaxID=1137989 RepID=UPI0031F32822